MNNNTDFDQNIALALLKSDDEFPVDFDLAWQWLEFTTKNNAKSSLIDCGFDEGQDFRIFMANHENSTNGLKTSSRGRKSEKIWLTIDCFKSWGMMCRNNKGKQIRKYFLQCERNLKKVIQTYLPKPKSLLDLSTTQLYQLAAYKLAIEFGKQPDPELIEGIDPAHLEATVDAAQYAYYAKIAGIASGTKVANDIYREIGYMKTSRKEIEQERKDIVEMEQYIKKLEAGELGTKRKADFDRFESEQIALFEATQAARASLEASFEN